MGRRDQQKVSISKIINADIERCLYRKKKNIYFQIASHTVSGMAIRIQKKKIVAKQNTNTHTSTPPAHNNRACLITTFMIEG